MFKMLVTFNKLSTVYLIDKRRCFKSFVRHMTSIRLELSSSNAESEKSCATSNFKIAYYFF